MSRKAWLTVGAVVALLAGVGAGFAAGSSTTDTVTETRTLTKTKTETTVRTRTVTRTVKVQPTLTTTSTVTRTRTIEQPPASVLTLDYGQYGGVVRALGLQWYLDDTGYTHVVGQLQYLGGLACGVLSYAEVDATFFDSANRTTAVEIGNATGLPQGSRVPFEITTDARADRVELLLIRADC